MHTTHYTLAILACICTLRSIQGLPTPYQAMTTVPVAELIGEPIKYSLSGIGIEQAYLDIPLDLPFGEKKPNPFPICPRVHQLLLHEQVTVLEECGDEVRVMIPNLFFVTATQQQPQCTYWMLKKNSTPIAHITVEQQQYIPASISFAEKKIAVPNSVTLIYPVTDAVTGQTFSAGTRFIYIPAESMHTQYTIYAYDNREKIFKKTTLPKKYCLPKSPTNNAQKIKQFVSLVRAWAHLKHGSIAYVWGGRSFTTKKNTAQIRTITTEGLNYKIADQKPGAKSGFDCSGLVATAAQLCEIPYFFKNSTTVATYLAPLRSGENLEEGDIILTTKPNHVMIVSDMKKNKLTEARTIAHGYGKVHEIPLSEEFQGIHTYADLVQAYHAHTPIKRLRKDGSVIATIAQIKLFKLASVWK